jgi:hypothetical protein
MRPGKSLTWIRHGVGALAALIALGSAAAGCGGTDDRPATWSYIYPAILEPSCATASCHSKFAARSGVDLSTSREAYSQLVDRHFVIPGPDPLKAADSELLFLLRAQGARRMPPDFPLPTVDIALIEEWIVAGALAD